MKDGVASKDYVNLELLHDQLKNLDQSIITIENELDYANITIETVNELKIGSDDQELLVPVGNGVFFSVTKPSDVKKIKIAVGAGVLVEKTLDDAIVFIKKQIDSLSAQREETIKLYDRVANEALLLQQKIESDLRSKSVSNNQDDFVY